MKYKTENEFCIETTKLLLGLVAEGQELLCVPEVPKGFGSNEHTDMLIIDKTEKRMFAIEYKLNDLTGLTNQVKRNLRVATIGIINRHLIEGDDNFGIYGMTGEDYQWER